MAGEIRIRGLFELNRELLNVSRDVRVGTRKEILDLAVPVQRQAQALGLARIRNLGVPWSQMRVGQTPDIVYVAPVQRGPKRSNRKRPNLAPLLLQRAMVPALERNRPAIERGLRRVLDRVTANFNR